MQEILVAGETLVDFIPEEPGPLATVETFHRRAGGAPANVAVGLARLEEEPAFWTRLGADPFGDFLAETLAAAGVPETFVERDPDAKTGLAFVSLDPDADRAFSFHRDGSADTRMEPGTVSESDLDDATWVHAGGVTLADEPARTATLDLMSRAHDTTATVSFDPNARPELWDTFDFASTCREAFLLADIVKVSPGDLAEASYDIDGVDSDDSASVTDAVADVAADVAADGPHTVLLTLGDKGALAYATSEAPWNDGSEPLVVDHPGYTVEPVDTTGAGDAFTAGAVAALSGGEPLQEALTFANAVAACTTTAKGAMTALPTRGAVEEFRRESASRTPF